MVFPSISNGKVRIPTSLHYEYPASLCVLVSSASMHSTVLRIEQRQQQQQQQQQQQHQRAVSISSGGSGSTQASIVAV